MNLPGWKAIRRHPARLGDLGFVFVAVTVTAFLAWQFDIFVTEANLTTDEVKFELNEVLLLGALLAIGLFTYSTRRLVEQKREMRRRMAAERSVRELAYQDALTGLPNRRQFDEALREAIDSPPAAGSMHAVLMLDLNGFKKINDVFGHGVGDEVLIVVAQRLMAAKREGDLVARLGGDEFAILSKHLSDAEVAANVALRVINSLESPIAIGSTKHQVGTAIGIALIPRDATDIPEALRKADVALYRAKSQRRSSFRFFEEDMDVLMHERDELERELRSAVAAKAIEVVYQPVMDLRTNEILGFEALPRWNHPQRGEIPVERFMAIAEEVGLMHELFDGLMREACAAAATWPETMTLSVDIYPVQLADADLKNRILQILDETGLSPVRLEIEIAEVALVRHLESVRDVLGGLRQKGIKIVLGNFGTGYSSLYHLRNFKLDKIKIDRGFIETMNFDRTSAEVVEALIGLGHGLGFTVSAEGVRDWDQSAALLDSGCQQGQGSLFSTALTSQSVAELLAGRGSACAERQLQLVGSA